MLYELTFDMDRDTGTCSILAIKLEDSQWNKYSYCYMNDGNSFYLGIIQAIKTLLDPAYPSRKRLYYETEDTKDIKLILKECYEFLKDGASEQNRDAYKQVEVYKYKMDLCTKVKEQASKMLDKLEADV